MHGRITDKDALWGSRRETCWKREASIRKTQCAKYTKMRVKRFTIVKNLLKSFLCKRFEGQLIDKMHSC